MVVGLRELGVTDNVVEYECSGRAVDYAELFSGGSVAEFVQQQRLVQQETRNHPSSDEDVTVTGVSLHRMVIYVTHECTSAQLDDFARGLQSSTTTDESSRRLLEAIPCVWLTHRSTPIWIEEEVGSGRWKFSAYDDPHENPGDLSEGLASLMASLPNSVKRLQLSTKYCSGLLSNLSHLQHLESLKIEHDVCVNFTLGDARALAEVVLPRNYPHLKRLEIDSELDPRCRDIIARAAFDASLSQLDRLSLRSSMAGLDLLKTNMSVTRLNLSFSSLGNEGAVLIAEAVTANHCVSVLGLASCDIGAEGGCALGRALGANQSVEHLDLSDNSIGDKGGVEVAKGLEGNNILRSLDLSSNGLRLSAAEAFYAALSVNKTLESLDLEDNRIGAVGCAALSMALPLSTLKCLNLSYNLISSEGLLMLCLAMKKNRQMTSLVVHGNDDADPVVSQEFVHLVQRFSETLTSLSVAVCNGRQQRLIDEACLTNRRLAKVCERLQNGQGVRLPAPAQDLPEDSSASLPDDSSLDGSVELSDDSNDSVEFPTQDDLMSVDKLMSLLLDSPNERVKLTALFFLSRRIDADLVKNAGWRS